MKVAGQKAQPFAGLHGGTGQHDAVHLLVPESGHRRRHCQIRLTGTGRAHADGDGVAHHGVHILLLADGLGLHGPALAGDADHVLSQLADALGLAAAAQPDDVAHMLLVDGLTLGAEGQQCLHGLFRQHHVFRLPGNNDLTAPIHHLHLKFRLQQPDILIKGAEQVDGLLHTFNADALFHIISLLS